MSQGNEARAPNILELLVDMSSHLQVIEHCIQTREKAEKAAERAAVTMSSEEDIPLCRAAILTRQGVGPMSRTDEEMGSCPATAAEDALAEEV